MKFILLLFALFFCFVSSGQNVEDVLKDLDKAIKEKKIYAQQKEQRIERLKKSAQSNQSLLQEYQLNQELSNEYHKYDVKQSISLMQRNVDIAKILKDDNRYYLSLICLSSFFTTNGEFRVAENILRRISVAKLSKEALADYYECYSKFFSQYLVSNYTEYYQYRSNDYKDSLLNILDHNTLRYQMNYAERLVSQKEMDKAEPILFHLIDTMNYDNSNYALATYLLARINAEKGHIDKAKSYYALSAISDIKGVIRENSSIYMLAILCNEEGDISRAYRYAKSALDDAVEGDIRFRTIQTSELFTSIHQSYVEIEAKHKQHLWWFLVVMILLAVFLAVAVFFIYKQIKKVSRIKEKLAKTNCQLAQINSDILQKNNQLNEQNAQLYESNRIKEEYIAHFFDICSTYISKLEKYRKTLNKAASERRLDDLYKMLKSSDVVDSEIEELYRNFDTIFLNLYPTFVDDFNALLFDNEKIILKTNELLNAELRIYALIRLGINDSVKIASFLRYSMSTIYNYRSKIRTKISVSREEFEKMVMQIGRK